MSIDLSQFFETFFEEAGDHLAEMERQLLNAGVSTPSDEDLDTIFRAAHSIKGGAGIFGFNRMAQLTHEMESLLDKVRSHERPLSEEMADVFLRAVDYLRDLLAVHRASGEVDEASFEAMRTEVEALNHAAPAASAPQAEVEGDGFGLFAADSPKLGDDGSFGFFESAEKPAYLAEDDSFGLFAAAEKPPALQEDDAFGLFEDSKKQPALQEDASFGLFEALPVAAVASAPTAAVPVKPAATHGSAAVKAAPANPDNASIRVSVERVDQLINLVGELVITQAMLTETGRNFEGKHAERLQHSIELLQRNTRDLQESVMSIRMLPISFVFNRFPRVVRDLSQKLGKQVELVIQGEGTELDRTLIEKLTDPLTHLVRNSIDHGIESIEKRQTAGKNPRGTITLNAYQRSGNIVVEVSDDGNGLNRERILEKAKERGLPAHDGMSDTEVWLLIFAPGFSTADVVTDVSGRGVGMDVVKRNIADLGGSVEVTSSASKGSRFTIRLPLTLAILDGMSVSVGKETFIIPLTFILESLQPKAEDIRRVAGDGEVVRVRGEYLPLLPLWQMLGVPGRQDPTQSIVLLVQSGSTRAAVQVDDLLGQHQVVIKSLEANFRRVAGVSGATVMGDGHVALILDIADLLARRSVSQAA